jgi:3-deoxy-D-manno-octulosonic-acid transferase
MGEVPLFYAAADVAFVGGTLVPVGGHNLLEPAALGLPVVTGPHLFNTQDIADKFTAIGALIRVDSAAELADAVGTLLQEREEAMRLGRLGKELVAANRGALEGLMKLIEPLLAAPRRAD